MFGAVSPGLPSFGCIAIHGEALLGRTDARVQNAHGLSAPPRYEPMSRPTLFEALGGEAGVLRLAHAWHARVLADDVVAHAFSHGFHPRHTERLAAYWAEAWGGPPRYTEALGTESSVVRMHSGNGDHHEMDRRAIACFDQAMDDVALENAALRQALHDYFEWTTTTTMAAYPDSKAEVPGDLRLPRWSWNGLQP